MKFFDLEMDASLALSGTTWVGDNGHGGCTHRKYTHGTCLSQCMKDYYKKDYDACTIPTVEPIEKDK